MMLEDVHEEPALLLNAGEEERRQFLEAVLGEAGAEGKKLQQVVALVSEIVELLRAAYEAQIAGQSHRLEHEIMPRLEPLWRRARPAEIMLDAPVFVTAGEHAPGIVLIANRIEEPNVIGRAVGAVLRELVRRQPRAATCEECGVLLAPHPMAPDQRFCSDRCRKRTARRAVS